jgi:4-amino-4-deoxy-L-arabinose transferase-like glycosyltransferase
MKGRTPLWILCGVIAAYLACALPRLTALPRVNVDEPWMMQLAWQLATAGRITLPMFEFHDTFLLQPGYSLLMAPWMRLVGPGIFEARLLTVLMGLVTLVLVYRIGSLLESRVAGLVAAAFLALDSNFLGAVRSTRHDIMSLLFIVVSLWLLLEGRRTERRAAYFFSGLAAGVAMVFHANAYWAVAVAGLWLLAIHGWRLVLRSPGYVYAAGFIVPLLPLLWHLDQYRRQLMRFVGPITPSLDPARIAQFIAAEPPRYRYWYFGLVTIEQTNPWLWLFQLSLVAGLVVMILRLVRSVRARAFRAADHLLLLHVGASAFLFAGFVPNKVVAYLPHLLIGFALAAGTAWSAAVNGWMRMPSAGRAPRLAWRLGAVALALYIVTGVVRYQMWIYGPETASLTRYEDTVDTLDAVIPGGPKYVIAFPTFWLAFRDHAATTFYSITAVAPPGFPRTASYGFQTGVAMESLTTKPVYVLFDEAHWTPMFSVKGPFEDGWRDFVRDHCSVVAVAPASAYGTLATYACAPRDGKPQVATRWVAYNGDRWTPTGTIWEAGAQDFARWERHSTTTEVAVSPAATTVTGTQSAGVCASVAVTPTSTYMLTYDAQSTGAGDLLSLAYGESSDDAMWRALTKSPWYPQEVVFTAERSNVRLCFYSETPTRFELRGARLMMLQRVPDQPGADSIP